VICGGNVQFSALLKQQLAEIWRVKTVKNPHFQKFIDKKGIFIHLVEK
jgi:hypothetical protein